MKSGTTRKKPSIRLRWAKEALQDYRDEVHNQLSEIEMDVSTPLGIDTAVHMLQKTLTDAAKKHLPISKTSAAGLKKVSPTVVNLRKVCKLAFYKWKKAGRPGKRHHTSVALKDAKRQLRHLVRKETAQREALVQEEIMSSSSSNDRTFYRLIKKQGKTTEQNTTSITYQDQQYEGPDQVCKGFAAYFAELGKPKESPNFVDEHKVNVEADVALLQEHNLTSDQHTIISMEDVENAISKLKPHKAADSANVSGEHLLYAKNEITFYLTDLFNGILLNSYVPTAFLLGCIKPIWKKKGGKEDPTKYRGITISSTVGKVFEEVITQKILPLFASQQSQLQFGFTANTAILSASLILAEGIHRSSPKTQTLATFLDAEKAFDVVWQDGLLRKLALLGVPADLWTVLSQWYKNIKATITWEGKSSTEFLIRQGVRQGGVGSPLLYKVFINDLLLDLERMDASLTIGSIHVACPTVADDVLLLSKDHERTQDLLDTVHEYVCHNRYCINASKSVVLQYHPKTKNLSPSHLYLGEEILKTGDEILHLGILQGTSTSLNADRAKRNISLARSMMYSLLGTGIRGGSDLNPTVGVKIYNLYVAPRLIYGAELWTKSKRAIESLNGFHLRALKIIQGLPDRTANAGTLALVGALPITAKIHQARLSLLWNVISDDDTTTNEIISRHYIMEIPNSWVSETAEILYMYNLPTIADLLIDLPTKTEWKRITKLSISDYWSQVISDDIRSKTSLKYLTSDTAVLTTPHPVWTSGLHSVKTSKRANIRAKLLTGTYTLQGNISRFNQHLVDPTCRVCSNGPEDRVHFVALCPVLNDVRRNAYHELRNITNTPAYHQELDAVMNDPKSLAQLLINPQHLSIISTDILTLDEIVQMEKCVTSACYLMHIARWNVLVNSQQGD